MTIPCGPLMVDIAGTTLTSEDQEVLSHAAVGGLIFFARNFESRTQIAELVQAIRTLRPGPFLIAVDHEGGRVQRFKTGFTHLPSMRTVGMLYQQNPEQGLTLADTIGQLMAAELLSVGIDLSFAPVLDLDWGVNDCIGDRAFHQDPTVVSILAARLIDGMHAMGMAAVGKHFPGHGHVRADSHLALPIDERPLADLLANDLKPFLALLANHLDGIMAAHIIYPEIDSHTAGFSSRWLETLLRQAWGYQGMIFSDALDMKGAHGAGDMLARVEASLHAGVDMALLCNDRNSVLDVLHRFKLSTHSSAAQAKRLMGDRNKAARWLPALEELPPFLSRLLANTQTALSNT